MARVAKAPARAQFPTNRCAMPRRGRFRLLSGPAWRPPVRVPSSSTAIPSGTAVSTGSESDAGRLQSRPSRRPARCAARNSPPPASIRSAPRWGYRADCTRRDRIARPAPRPVSREKAVRSARPSVAALCAASRGRAADGRRRYRMRRGTPTAPPATGSQYRCRGPGCGRAAAAAANAAKAASITVSEFRARDQRGGRNGKVEAPEFALPDDQRQRFACEAPASSGSSAAGSIGAARSRSNRVGWSPAHGPSAAARPGGVVDAGRTQPRRPRGRDLPGSVGAARPPGWPSASPARAAAGASAPARPSVSRLFGVPSR